MKKALKITLISLIIAILTLSLFACGNTDDDKSIDNDNTQTGGNDNVDTTPDSNPDAEEGENTDLTFAPGITSQDLSDMFKNGEIKSITIKYNQKNDWYEFGIIQYETYTLKDGKFYKLTVTDEGRDMTVLDPINKLWYWCFDYSDFFEIEKDYDNDSSSVKNLYDFMFYDMTVEGGDGTGTNYPVEISEDGFIASFNIPEVEMTCEFSKREGENFEIPESLADYEEKAVWD